MTSWGNQNFMMLGSSWAGAWEQQLNMNKDHLIILRLMRVASCNSLEHIHEEEFKHMIPFYMAKRDHCGTLFKTDEILYINTSSLDNPYICSLPQKRKRNHCWLLGTNWFAFPRLHKVSLPFFFFFSSQAFTWRKELRIFLDLDYFATIMYINTSQI